MVRYQEKQLELPTGPLSDYLARKPEIDAAIERVLSGGWYILGREVEALEQEFAGYIGVTFGIGVGSGTDAVHLALRACGVGPGDEVVTVAHTAVATVAGIEQSGAKPVLVDIDPRTYTIDPERIERALTAQTRAVVPVHLYGHPANMEAIKSIAARNDLYVIEDCAQSHGATHGGRKTGSWGHMAAFSFYPTKNLGAIGDGGMVLTDDPELAERARQLRQYGWRNRNDSEIAGVNSRLDELQAAILRVKLRYLDEDNARRHELAELYPTILSSSGLTLPQESDGNRHAYHLYVVRSDERDSLKAYLQDHGVDAPVHYPIPVHLQSAYKGRLGDTGMLPNTELVCGQILSLPMHPHLTEEHIRAVSDVILRWSAISHEQ